MLGPTQAIHLTCATVSIQWVTNPSLRSCVGQLYCSMKTLDGILVSMERTGSKQWLQGKAIKDPLKYDEDKMYKDDEVEIATHISQDQLNGARLFTSKYEYAKTLDKNIAYLEVGVGWGNSAKMFIDTTNAISADLLDFYNNADGTRVPGGADPGITEEGHEEYIKNKFSYHPNVNTIKGDMRKEFFKLKNRYDFMFFDGYTDRIFIRNVLKHASQLINPNGVIGFTSYLIYDAIHYDRHPGVYQSVNEFLNLSNNWSVDGIVLHDLGFHEIYIKKNA